MNTSQNKLHDLTVLITRPTELAKSLARQIGLLGAHSIIYPVISIQTPENNEPTVKLLQQLEDFDIAIFISPTAVGKTFEQLPSLPSSLQIAAIGSSTQLALENKGVSVEITSQGHNSESLLTNTLLQTEQIAGKAIIIFRGRGGREMLGDTLRTRGARVHYAEVYQRVRPLNAQPLTDDEINVLGLIAITSNEGLQNLYDINTNTDLLTQKPLIVPGARTQALAEKLGFVKIIQAENATDAACIAAIKDWAS